MNTVNAIYDIRFARLDEGDLIVDFYRKHWDENHALVKNRSLFDFQHKSDDRYNVVIAYNTISKEIDATWGIIPVSQYDRNLQKNGDYWGAILKIRNDVDNNEIKGLFFRLYKFVLSIPGMQSYISYGMGELGMRVTQPFNRHYGIMNQYYIANQLIQEFRIGQNLVKSNCVASKSSLSYLDISSINKSPNSIYKPLKSLEYIINRYAKHPIYKYGYLGVFNEDEMVAIFVIRKIHVLKKGYVIRIVDCLGDLSMVGSLVSDFQSILNNEEAEYIDFLNYGIEHSVMNAMGFIKLDIQQNNIIVPSYFEPFERSNVAIRYAFNMNGSYTIFKADSDQDRPKRV